jgi:hypothetical protein
LQTSKLKARTLRCRLSQEILRAESVAAFLIEHVAPAQESAGFDDGYLAGQSKFDTGAGTICFEKYSKGPNSGSIFFV